MTAIAGSRSLTGQIRGRWEVLLTLAMAQLRDRFGRGGWQIAKWIVDPYAATGVYMIFVAFIVDRGSGQEGLIVACAIVPFQLFIQAFLASLSIVRERGSLIQNLDFPRELLPTAATITETIGFAASLTLLPLMMLAYGVGVTTAIVWLPVVMAVNIALALAAAYMGILLGTWYRELTPFFVSVMRILLFLAPGVVALSEITGKANDLVRANPLTGIFEAYRSVLAYGEAPALWELAFPLAFSVVVVGCLAPILRREAPHLAKVV